MKNLINKSINFFIIYFIYLIIISLSTYIFLEQFIQEFDIADENNNLILKNITFGHGPLIHNLFYNGEFSQNLNGVDFFLKKTFALPFLLFLISKFSLNIYFVIIVKNIILYSVYFFVSLQFFKHSEIQKKYFLFLILVPLFIPYNFYVSLNFNFEDCLLALLIPSLYLTLISEKWKISFLFASFILFAVYFVKTSTFFLVLVLPIFIFILEKKKYKFLPVLFSLFAIIIWGSFGLVKTGKFPIGPTGTSINSKVLASSMNIEFNQYYPKYSTDLIPVENILKKKNFIKSEWEFYEYYNKKNKKYLKENLNRFLKDIFIKIKFILFNVKKDGTLDIAKNEQQILISHIISKILFNLSLIILFYNIFLNLFIKRVNFKNIFKDKLLKKDIYFFLFLILLIPPHILAWATSKHLVPITSVSIIYLYSYFFDRISYRNH